MLTECKNDQEKVAMGLLSYLPDFKNLKNLKDEIRLNKESAEFKLYLYREQAANFIGVMGTQVDDQFIIIRFISLAPDFRSAKYQAKMVNDLASNNPNKCITAMPDYSYLMTYLTKNKES